MYKEVRKWLSALKIPVSEHYLRLRIETHPDYPSLLAVSDTLDELGIDCNAYETDKRRLKNIHEPILFHLRIGDGYVVYFSNISTAEKKIKDFDKYWSGIIMLAERRSKTTHEIHDQQLRKENREKLFSLLSVSMFVCLLSVVLFFASLFPLGILSITNIAGLFISWLIVQKEFGIQNKVSNAICNVVRYSRCESILFSRGAGIFNWFTWGDTGIVYFSTSIFFLSGCSLIPALQTTGFQFYYLLSFACMLFPLYSLYFQWLVVKQWCMLCISVLGILTLNTTVAGFYYNIRYLSLQLLYPATIFFL